MTRSSSRTDPHSCTPYSSLSQAEMKSRMSNLHSELQRIQKQYDRMKERLKKAVQVQGVTVGEGSSKDLVAIMTEHGSDAIEKSETTYFQKDFWEQQLQAARKDVWGMRWHPLMIKWLPLFLCQVWKCLWNPPWVPMCAITITEHTEGLHSPSGGRSWIFSWSGCPSSWAMPRLTAVKRGRSTFCYFWMRCTSSRQVGSITLALYLSKGLDKNRILSMTRALVSWLSSKFWQYQFPPPGVGENCVHWRASSSRGTSTNHDGLRGEGTLHSIAVPICTLSGC